MIYIIKKIFLRFRQNINVLCISKLWWKKNKYKKVSKLSILAVLFSAYAYLLNIPRLIKLKYFPGVGKQNYT